MRKTGRRQITPRGAASVTAPPGTGVTNETVSPGTSVSPDTCVTRRVRAEQQP